MKVTEKSVWESVYTAAIYRGQRPKMANAMANIAADNFLKRFPKKIK